MSEPTYEADDEKRTEVSIRRAPKLSTFLAVGVLVGFLAALILTSLFPADPKVGYAATLGFFSLFGVAIGAALGAVVALVLDRRASRRARTVVAGKLDVHAASDEETPDGEGTGFGGAGHDQG
jgi:hypothetical protein